METKPSRLSRWLIVVLFAIAMAWNESAVVLYLRTISHRLNPYQTQPLPMVAGLAKAEIVREAATIVMLATVGWLAGRNFRTRFGYFVIAFGVWDIAYYVFLKPLTGWPNSLMDWDVLFLIPLPWWGPVVAPVLIAVLMIMYGTLVTQCDDGREPPWPGGPAVVAFGAGATLALFVFMADALRLPVKSEAALRELLPTQFLWPQFVLAWLLMATPVLEVAWRIRTRTRRSSAAPQAEEEMA